MPRTLREEDAEDLPDRRNVSRQLWTIADSRQSCLSPTIATPGTVLGVFLALALAASLLFEPSALAVGIEPVGPSTLRQTVSKSDREWLGPFDAPRSPLEEELFADAADGRLDRFSPFTAALVASGVNDYRGLSQYQQKAAGLADELRRSGTLGGTPHERAEAVFEFMHHRILTGGYDLAFTDLRRVLDEGRFNCVSATVLYNYLATEIGLYCCGLEMPGHAMSRVRFEGESLDVETTCPQWFARRDSPAWMSAAASKLVDSAAAADRSKAREVSAIPMAAMIYYNRGVDLLNERHFAEAARANAKALRLDPRNATARGNLLATLNNWAIDLGNTKHFVEAIGLLKQGLTMDPTFSPFSQNYVHVHRQWTDQLCREGRFDEAMEVLHRVIGEQPDRTELLRVQGEVAAMKAKAVAVKSP